MKIQIKEILYNVFNKNLPSDSNDKVLILKPKETQRAYLLG